MWSVSALSCFYQLMCYDFAMSANEYLHSYQNESLGELESQRLSVSFEDPMN